MVATQYYSVATLPDPTTQPGNVQVIIDAQESEYLLSGTVPIGGGTFPMRVKSYGGEWLTYGRVRVDLTTRDSSGGGGGSGGGVGVNLLAGANDFSNAAWSTVVNVTKFDSGLVTQAIKETAINGEHYLAQEAAFVGPGTVRVTVNAKANLSRDFLRLYLLDQSFTDIIGKYINITTGTNGSTVLSGAKLSNIVPLTPAAISGGYTVGFEADADATVTSLFVLLGIATADGVDIFLGDITKGMTLSNAQLVRLS